MHDHEDCFKREHDISAAWARAEDEVKALKLQLDDQAQKYNAILDEHQVEFVKLNQENAALREKVGAWKRYRALLTEELSSAVGLAWIHGWRSTDERIARGKELRKELGIEEGQCPNCPPEKNCMKWNGCSCECHKTEVVSENRRDRNNPPRGGMIWNSVHQMWTDPDTRTPERKALDEKIVRDIDARLKPRDPIKLDQQGRVIYVCGKCGEEKVNT